MKPAKRLPLIFATAIAFFAVLTASISTFAWFQINNSVNPGSTVQTNGMRTDAFVYQRDSHSHDDSANKGPRTDASGTLTFDHSQGQPATSYYIMGNGSLWDGDFVSSSGLQMYKNPNNPNDSGVYWKINLAVGDEFKIYNSNGGYNVSAYWYGYSSISSSCTLKNDNFTEGSSGNIHVSTAGVYDIFVNIQNVITIQYHSDTRFSADTTNEIGYLIVGSGSGWQGEFDIGEGIQMTINKRSDHGIDKAMYAGLRLAAGDSFRVVDGASSHDNPTYYPTDNTDSNLAPRSAEAASTDYFSYSATNNHYTFTCRRTAYYCIYLNSGSYVNIQLWDGKANDGLTYYTSNNTPIGDPQRNYKKNNGSSELEQPNRLDSSGSQTIYFKDATWWSGNDADNNGTYIYMWNDSWFDSEHIYFYPNSDWRQSGAWFAAYFNNSTTGANKWVGFSEYDSDNHIYRCDFDGTTNYDQVIFKRMNPANPDSSNHNLNDGNKWNQCPNSGYHNIGTDNYWRMTVETGYNDWNYYPTSSSQKTVSVNNGSWPGVPMTRVAPASSKSTSVPNYYSYDFDASKFVNVIFSRHNGTKTDAKTADIALSSSGANNMYDISSTSAVWDPSALAYSSSYWKTYSAPSGITLSFSATYGSNTYTPSSVTIPYGGSAVVPTFPHHFGYTTPTVWNNGQGATINSGATVTYVTASGYASLSFSATYGTNADQTYYLDLYNLKFAGNVSGISNSPSFKIHAWDANGEVMDWAYGDSGFPASPITTNVMQNVDSSASGYDALCNFDYRYCFWSVTLPGNVNGYIVYIGSIDSPTWKSADITFASGNLATILSTQTDGKYNVTITSNCSGDVRKVTTTRYMDDTQTAYAKYNIFDHCSWTVPSASDQTGHTFTKWYSNTSGSDGTQYIVGNSYQINQDTVFYCLYSTNSYRLTKVIKLYRGGAYRSDGASSTYQDLVYNTPTNVTSVSYTGAVFDGWYSDSTCSTKISATMNFNYTIGASNATIYAKFNLQSVTLQGTYTYYNASGSVAKTSSSSTTVYVNDALTVSSNAVYNSTTSSNALASGIETGYFHDGWYSDSPMTSSWSSHTVTNADVASGIHLYAKLSVAKVYLVGSSQSLGEWSYSDSSYSQSASTTVTFSNVALTKGDQLKAYSPHASNVSHTLYPYDSTTGATVTGSAMTNSFVDLNSSDQYNIRCLLSGTYTITLTMDASYNVTAITVVATALAASNFSVNMGINGGLVSPTFTASGNVFTSTFHAYIGDTFNFKIDRSIGGNSNYSYLKPTITDSSSQVYQGLQDSGDYIRCNVDLYITITFTANLTTFGSSTCAVSEIVEHSITYAAGEHAPFDTATYFIQTADNNSFTSGVETATMHYPTDSTNYLAVYTGFTLSITPEHTYRYLRVLQRVSNSSNSGSLRSDSEYQVVFQPGGTFPVDYCNTPDYSNQRYEFFKNGVFDIKVHKRVSDVDYLEITLSQSTTSSATTHYADIYMIGRGVPGSDIRDGDYTTANGVRLHTYGGNTSNFPAFVDDGSTSYTAETFATAVSNEVVGTGIRLMEGDQFILTDGVSTFGPSSSGTGYTVSSGTVTITQSADYYIWATSTSSVSIKQKSGSVISDGRTAGDIAVDSSDDWKYDPTSYIRQHGARVLNASGNLLRFGGNLDYSLLDGCGDGYYHFYVELRNSSASSSGTVTYDFSNIYVPTGTKAKYKNAEQNNGRTLKSGFNDTTLGQLAHLSNLDTNLSITNSVTANENGFAGSTVIEVMIPISQIATASSFQFAFTITVSYEETL